MYADESCSRVQCVHTDLQRLCSERLHDSPHVQDELTHVFPNLTPMKHEGVGDGPVRLLGHMVGCCSGFLLVFSLKQRQPHINY